MAMATALSSKRGSNLPWFTVRSAIENGIQARWIELCDDSATWPCDLSGARYALFQVPISQEIHDAAGKLNTPKPQGLLTAEVVLEANGIQDLSDQIPDIMKAAVGNDLKFNVRVELGGETAPHPETVETINTLLSEVSDKFKAQEQTMTQLSVNLNKFALLRNSRGRDYPNVVRMGARCL